MTKERLDIGRQVYERLLTKEEAARKYGVSVPCIYAYIRFFNEERPSYALGYLTPAQFKAKYAGKPDQPKKPSKIAYERKKERIEKANQK